MPYSYTEFAAPLRTSVLLKGLGADEWASTSSTPGHANETAK